MIIEGRCVLCDRFHGYTVACSEFTSGGGVKKEELADLFRPEDDKEFHHEERNPAMYQYDSVPWRDTSKWKKDDWYPLPISSLWSEFDFVEGWVVYRLSEDSGNETDIDPISECMPIKNAVEICEYRNGTGMHTWCK